MTTSTRLIRRGVPAALAAGLGFVALCGGAPKIAAQATVAPVAAAPIAVRQHGPVKVHQRVYDGAWESTNWSGYAVTGANGSVTDAKGSWVVPAVTCTSTTTSGPGGRTGGPAKGTTAYSSFWVGIDGFSSSTVEQIGTDSDCQNGKAQYYAWFEFYPQASYLVPVTVKVGDVISAETIATGGGNFTVTLRNVTNGGFYSVSSKVKGAQQSSAEWIVEAPSGQQGTLPLANYGTSYLGTLYTSVPNTNFATVGGTTGSIGSFGTNVQSLTMVAEKKPYPVKADVSDLSSDGTSFMDKWFSAGP